MADAREGLGAPALYREVSWWLSGFGWLAGVFVLAVTITNFLHQQFEFQLLPVFENSLQGLRIFTHWALDALLIGWITWVLKFAWYGILVVLAKIVPTIVPYIPDISVPGWFKDLQLVSIMLLRANSRGDEAYRLSGNREVWSSAQGKEYWQEYTQEAGNSVYGSLGWIIFHISGIFVYPVLEVFRFLYSGLTGVNYDDPRARLLYWPFWTVVAGALMLGFLRFAEETFFAIATINLNNQLAVAKRGSLLWGYFTLMCAIVASAVFVVWNGYAIPSPP